VQISIKVHTINNNNKKRERKICEEEEAKKEFTLFLSMLKLSMMTPMKRLSVKKAPQTIKTTK
jgi:hypothetical protein